MAPVGDVRVRIVKPQGTSDPLPAVLYMHGAIEQGYATAQYMDWCTKCTSPRSLA